MPDDANTPTPADVYDPYDPKNCFCASGELVWQIQRDGSVTALNASDAAEFIHARYAKLGASQRRNMVQEANGMQAVTNEVDDTKRRRLAAEDAEG